MENYKEAKHSEDKIVDVESEKRAMLIGVIEQFYAEQIRKGLHKLTELELLELLEFMTTAN